ncbi:MAG: hypothetical protein WBV11_04105 [Salegentibacter sp.]
MEFLAAIAGLYFLKKADYTRSEKFFVGFLWWVIAIETINSYAFIAYFNHYQFLSFIKGTLFERNFWIANPNKVISYSCYSYFFIAQLHSARLKKILKRLLILYIITSIISFFIEGNFMTAMSSYTSMSGTVVLAVIIGAYYYEMLTSEKILQVFSSLAFYVSIAAVVWHLVVTPLYIYNSYFTASSPAFISLHSMILQISAVFMYGVYIFALIYCARQHPAPKRRAYCKS